MTCLRRCFVAGVLLSLLLWSPVELGAQISKVRLHWVGLPVLQPFNCLDRNLSVAPGDAWTLAFEGQLIAPGPRVSGRVRIVGADSRFEIVDRDPPITFRYERSSQPSAIRVRVKPGVLALLAQPHDRLESVLQLEAIDDQGVVSAPVSCTVAIERHYFMVSKFRVLLDPDGAYRVETEIANFRNATLSNVPWAITGTRIGAGRRIGTEGSVGLDGRQVPRIDRLGAGIVPGIAPRGVATVSARITPEAAGRLSRLSVVLDSANTLDEHEVMRSDNRASTSETAPIVVRELDPALAAAAGATFTGELMNFSPCIRIGVGDWQDRLWGGWAETPRSTGVLFLADCSSTGFPLPAPGFGRADAEAYKDFVLKNGWKIVSIDEQDVTPGSQPAGTFTWITRPAVGSSDPYMKATVSSGIGQVVKRGVRVFIEGRLDKNPYQ